MSGTKVFDAIDGIVTTWRAVAGYGTPDEVGVIGVFDGPVSDNYDIPAAFVAVGTRDLIADEDADDASATTSAVWRSMPVNAGSQTEEIDVPCLVGAWTGDADGDVDWTGLRAEVATILDALGAAVRTPAGIGPDVDLHTLTFTGGTLRQSFTSDGALVVFEFTVSITASN
jgi:hypothetical protein